MLHLMKQAAGTDHVNRKFCLSTKRDKTLLRLPLGERIISRIAQPADELHYFLVLNTNASKNFDGETKRHKPSVSAV